MYSVFMLSGCSLSRHECQFAFWPRSVSEKAEDGPVAVRMEGNATQLRGQDRPGVQRRVGICY